MTMPVYLFNLHDGEEVHIDRAGQHLPDDLAAWHEATRRAEMYMRNRNGALQADSSWRIDVFGEDGSMLCSIEVKARGKT